MVHFVPKVRSKPHIICSNGWFFFLWSSFYHYSYQTHEGFYEFLELLLKAVFFNACVGRQFLRHMCITCCLYRRDIQLDYCLQRECRRASFTLFSFWPVPVSSLAAFHEPGRSLLPLSSHLL